MFLRAKFFFKKNGYKEPKMVKKMILGFVLFLIGLIGFGFAIIYLINFHPAPRMDAKIVCADSAKTLTPGQSIRVLSWNVQFGAGRKYHFFYDRGKDVLAEKKDVEETLKKIVSVVKKTKPDIILFQEIDRHSKRTAFVDQLNVLSKELSEFGCWTSTPYFRSAYVPTPNHQHMGRVDMHLAVLSRFKIQKATRHALAKLNEPLLRQLFNLKRAVLEVEIPVEGGPSLVLLNTHFSAFSFGDGTLKKQANKFIDLAKANEKRGAYWVGGGDFNLLPPGDRPHRLGVDVEHYPKKDSPIDDLFQSIQPALSLQDYQKSPEAYHTYVPFNAKKADRWIDYLFVSKKVKINNYQVLQEYDISDHLPVVLDLTLLKKEIPSQKR